MSEEKGNNNEKEDENSETNNNKLCNNDNVEKEEKIEYSKMIGNYILFDQIGMGTFSKVTRALHILTEQIVAVKILEKEKIEDDIDVERIIREIEILKNINHPNIAQMYETYSTVHNIYLMMEYIEGGDLFDYINTNNFLSEQKACYIFRQLIAVIEYLNNMGISHRDIKPENILLDKDKKNIKVIDFGLSNYYNGKVLLHSSCGSPCYASPEMLSGEPYQGITTDLWSSGIVLYSMLVGSLPFDEQELQKLYEQIKIGKFYLPSTLSLEAIDFLKKILAVDPQKRIGLKEIKSHPWFRKEKNKMYKGINFEVEEYPCNMKVASYVIKHYFTDEPEMNIDSLVDMIKTNACNKYTATYYLTKKYILGIEDKYKVIEEEKNNINNKSLNNLSLNEKLLITNEKISNENEVKNIDNKKSKNNEDKKLRSKTEENEEIKKNDKKEKKTQRKNCPSIIINNNNKNNNIFVEQNNILLTENDYYKNIKKVSNKESKKKVKQNPSNKYQKDNKIEISNANLKNTNIMNNEMKKTNKIKQKINPQKNISNLNLKSTIIKRKNLATINNIKPLTERMNENGKKEIGLNKIINLINKNKKIRKKKSSPSSNNFNFYVINNIINKDKDRQELSNEIFNIKIHHRKNKSYSIINAKMKNIPKTHERINTEIVKYSKMNDKIAFANEDIKFTNINEQKDINNKLNTYNYSSNIINTKKISNSNLIINNNTKKRRNSNKTTNFSNNNKNLSSHNFNCISNSEKHNIKNMINIIKNSKYEKKQSITSNLTLGKNMVNKGENIYTNILNNTKKKQGNSFLVNYIKQKNLLNYTSKSNNISNHLKKQTHQRNFANARNHLTNFKTDVSNKSNNVSTTKNREKFWNDSLLSNLYFPTEIKANNNKIIKKGKTRDFGNKSHHKNKVI